MARRNGNEVSAMRRAIFIVLGASLLAGCGHDAGVEPGTGVVSTISEISVLGDGSFLGQSLGGIITRDGSLFVSDMQNSRVMELQGNQVKREFGRKGAGPGEYSYPGPLFVSADRLYVHDGEGRRINVYSLTGQFLLTVPIEGTVMTPFVVDDEGYIYVSTSRGDKAIKKYDDRGAQVAAFGSALSNTGDELQDRLRGRRHLLLDPDGDIVAVGQVVPVVEKYSTDGTLVRSADLSDHALFSKRLAYAEEMYRQSGQSNGVAMTVSSIAIRRDVLSMLVITGIPGDDLAANTFVEFDLRSWQVTNVSELPAEGASRKPWLTTHAFGEDGSMAVFDARTASIRLTAAR